MTTPPARIIWFFRRLITMPTVKGVFCCLLVWSGLLQTFTAAATAAGDAVAQLPPVLLDAAGNLVNEKGYLLMFHGFNSVKKEPPYFDKNSLDRKQLKMYADWGLNVVRLGVIWAALVPQKGVVNETYLERIEEIVNRMGEAGIYVILDMHQDGMSSLFNTYDAIPSWLLKEFPKPPWPFRFPWPRSTPPEPENNYEAYLTYACQSAFQCLYDDTAKAWQHWGDFWATIAQRFAQNSAVLGYELINEPFAGNIFTNPLRALPGKHAMSPDNWTLDKVDAALKLAPASLPR
ncbi:unnamed protein product [Protopolystoma xenopodis]|uniref:Glycoside hydrolase family 5 domain-containing protein n=1 Tax=Protopolystoma xenopodis TaxID=117903 RepID=A0A3S5C045_9PLAT|nr:unnamed protein product [Protopolystoma xenopodis]